MATATTTYHDWASQSTAAARLARLELYVGEIQAMLGAPDVSKDGASIDRSSLNTLLQTLLAQMDTLRGDASRASAGGRSVVRFRRVCG